MRICFLFAVFLVVAAAAYFHVLGLPDFLKRPLLRNLRAHGFTTQFSQARLDWGPSIVIENGAFSRADQPYGPHLSAAETALSLDLMALLHSQMQVESFQVSDGELELPALETNATALSLNHVQLGLKFFSNDVARLTDCRAEFRGIQIQLHGEVIHPAGLRKWRLPLRPRGPTNAAPSVSRLSAFERAIEKIKFIGTPALEVDVSADGNDMNSLRAEMIFDLPGAKSPWADVENLRIRAAGAELLHSGSDPFLQVRCSAENLSTRWAQTSRLSFTTTFTRNINSNLDATVNFVADHPSAALGTNLLRATYLSWNGSATLASSNFLPLAASGKLRALQPETPWGLAASINADAQAARAPQPFAAEPSWGPWMRFSPYLLDWRADVRGASTPKLNVDHVAFSGHWRAPQAVIENLDAELYGGQLSAGAILNVATRDAQCTAVGDVDPHRISQVLTPATQRWLAQFDWTEPPKVNAQVRLVLPLWTNRPPEWRTNLRTSLQIAGDFTVGAAAFRKVTVTSASSHFTYSNRVWDLPQLHAVRSEGDAFLAYHGSDETHEYRFGIDSHLDPKDVIPLLPAAHQHVMDDLSFPHAPHLRGEVRGRWRSPEFTGFTVQVDAPSFTARGERVDRLISTVSYTNRVLQVRDTQLSKDGGELKAPFASMDFRTQKVSVSNAFSTLDPDILQRVLGPRTPKFLEVIRFDDPPSVAASGSFTIHDALATDLHFAVRGNHFHWTNIVADHITGAIDWEGRNVVLTNIEASLYNTGTFVGWIVFDYQPHHGSGFRTAFTATDVDLPSLVTGLTGKTNRLEGMLDGQLSLDGPLTTDRQSWLGHGNIHVHNALLWDIKIFGVLSPVLNAIAPGSGDSRAHAATATFVITNGQISTEDLDIRATGFRLMYRGELGLNKQIDARVEADLLRDTPVLGAFLSLALTPLSKLFEYHVSGNLHSPVMEPVFVPRFLMLLLRPFHTLKTLMPSGSGSSSPDIPLVEPKDLK